MRREMRVGQRHRKHLTAFSPSLTKPTSVKKYRSKGKKKRARGEKLPVVPIKVARPRCCCGIPSFCKAKILKSMVQKTCKLFSASSARMVSPNLLRKSAHLDPLFGQPWPDQQLDAPQRECWV